MGVPSLQHEAVTATAQRFNRCQLACGVEFAPQPPDQHLQHIAVAVFIMRVLTPTEN